MVANSFFDPGYKGLHSEKYCKIVQFKIYHCKYHELKLIIEILISMCIFMHVVFVLIIITVCCFIDLQSINLFSKVEKILLVVFGACYLVQEARSTKTCQ